MKTILKFFLIPILLYQSIYAINVTAELVSIEEFDFSMKITNINISVVDNYRLIHTTLAINSSSDIICAIYGYDPITKRYNFSYIPSKILLNGIATKPIFDLKSGIADLKIQDNLEVPHVYLLCYSPVTTYRKNIMEVGHFTYNLLATTYEHSLQKTFFQYVIPVRIIPMIDKIEIVYNVTIPIIFNTHKYISKGILKADCSDIAITVYDPITDTETIVPFWIDPATCNTENTIIYVKIPEYVRGKDVQLHIYMGNPDLVSFMDPYAVFSWFINFAIYSDYSKIQIFTTGDASYDITPEGLSVNIVTGKLVIYNK